MDEGSRLRRSLIPILPRPPPTNSKSRNEFVAPRQVPGDLPIGLANPRQKLPDICNQRLSANSIDQHRVALEPNVIDVRFEPRIA
jgi:hypothetical protein